MGGTEVCWRKERVRATNAVWFVGVEAASISVVAPPGVSISRREEPADEGGERAPGWIWAVWRRPDPDDWPVIDRERATAVSGIDTAEALRLLGDGFRESVWDCLWGQLQIARQVGSPRLGRVPSEDLARAGAQSVAWLLRELRHVFPDRTKQLGGSEARRLLEEATSGFRNAEPVFPHCGHFGGPSAARRTDLGDCPLCHAERVCLGIGEVFVTSNEMRAGALALALAANAINREIIRGVAGTRVAGVDGGHYEVGPAGWDALHISAIAERWLRNAPGGPLSLEDDEDAGPVKTLLDGWISGIVHALARGPRTLEEVEEATGLPRRAARIRVAAMCEDEMLAEQRLGEDGEVRYAATDWLRAAVGPLAAAARNELRHPHPEAVPLEAIDVEAAFLLSLPLLELPAELAGTCRLSVELDGEPEAVTARVESGSVLALGPEAAPEEADAWASGSAEAWLDTLIEPDAKRVRTGGDKRLARLLLDGLHERLFAVDAA